LRVLIVDDDEVFCLLLAEVLEREGIAVAWTTDSIAGCDMAVREDYDLFIVDVRMPLLSGTEFTQRLKLSKPRASVVLISAFANHALQETATHLGAALLSKPFCPSALLKVMSTLLGQPVVNGKP
jgi:DNA-binding response OmpR family regulator